jgi:acetoacetate decarboxylase
MGFCKTPEELAAWYANPVREFPQATMAGVMFTADSERTRALLPPPLEQADMPGGLIFVAEYGANNLGAGYREAALFLRCSYNGVPGAYCLSMPIDSPPDRMHNGRDIFGFPKKAARIHFERDDSGAGGWVERNGVRFLELRVETMAALPELPPQGPTYLFKASPRIDLQPGFDGPVLLCEQKTEILPRSIGIGTASLTIRPSAADPWSDLGDVEVLMAFVIDSHNRMLPGRVLAEVDGAAFLPHYFKMTDFGAEEVQP